jgi:hypothetical protein
VAACSWPSLLVVTVAILLIRLLLTARTSKYKQLFTGSRGAYRRWKKGGKSVLRSRIIMTTEVSFERIWPRWANECERETGRDTRTRVGLPEIQTTLSGKTRPDPDSANRRLSFLKPKKAMGNTSTRSTIVSSQSHTSLIHCVLPK